MDKRSLAWLAAALELTAYLGIASGQPSPVADVELSIVQGAPPVTLPGTTSTIVFQLTNHGPDIAGQRENGEDAGLFFISETTPFMEGLGVAVHFTRPVADDCVSLIWGVITPGPGQLAMTAYAIEFPSLPPGESFTCTLQYEVNPYIEWIAPSSPQLTEWFSFMLGSTDPNPTNDRRTTAFQFIVPEPIPTLSPAGLTLMALAMVAAFAWVRRRSATDA